MSLKEQDTEVLREQYRINRHNPELRKQIVEELESRGFRVTKVPSKKIVKEHSVNSLAIAVAGGFFTCFLLFYLTDNNRKATATDISISQKETVSDHKEETTDKKSLLSELGFNIADDHKHLEQDNRKLSKRVQDLEEQVALLEIEKEKLLINLAETRERLWNLAVLSNENWARSKQGSKDMVYLGKDWLPEDEVKNVENEAREKMKEKQRLAEEKKTSK
jgi:hypothetical protein